MEKMKPIKIVFLSGLFPTELETTILKNSKIGMQNAANNLQWGIVNGLVHHSGGNLLVVNSMYIGSFPQRYKKIMIRNSLFEIEKNNIKGINTSFINLPFIKQVSKYLSLKKNLNKVFRDAKYDYILIGYAMTNHVTKTLRHYSLRDNIKTILFTPDLPEYMNFTRRKSILWSTIKNHSIKSNYKNIRFIDGFVFLTKHMSLKQPFLGKPYTIIEGIANSVIDLKHTMLVSNNKFKVFYSGGLNCEYGVKELLDSFSRIKDENIELHLCGDGELRKYIKEYSEIDSRVKYYGVIKRDEVLAIQQESQLLINPRRNTSEFTMYSFPSKILEYMSSGTPVLMYKLDGIPDEYYDKVFLIDNYKSIESAIIELSKIDKINLIEYGLKAKTFVHDYKNPVKQTKKIIELISEIKKF